MNILGISPLSSSNPASALLKDGKLVAFAEEERFNRVKHSPSHFPFLSAYYCLKEAGLNKGDIDYDVGLVAGLKLGKHYVAIGGESHHQILSELIELKDFKRFMSAQYDDNDEAVINNESLFRYLPYDRDASYNDHLTYQYAGRFFDVNSNKIGWLSHHLSHVASTCIPSNFSSCNFMSFDGVGGALSGMIGFFDGKDFEIYDKFFINESFGAYYSAVTETLGFHRHGGEGKTMGLASYGNVNQATLPFYAKRLGTFNEFKLDAIKYNKWAKSSYLPSPTDDTILTSAYVDRAATCQHYFEKIIIDYARHLHKRTGNKNFAVAGGSFLNCSANGKLLEQDFVDNLFIQPASHDAGVALGAAILTHHLHKGEFPEADFSTAYWGSSFEEHEVLSTLQDFPNVTYENINPAETIPELLYEDKIIGYMAGKAEVGPRALCHRSILANPTNKDNLNRVNKIKGREFWRPLAPTMTEESLHDIVHIKHVSPFMLMAAQVKNEWKEKIPAVVHVDGSCRPQSVNSSQNPVIHKALLNFEKKSGVPVFLNTSFNLDGEPLVDSPNDALKTFLNSSLDVLIIENILIKRK